MAMIVEHRRRIPGAGNKKRGIALLVTVIFMSVMLAFGLALASLAYKQSILASDATQAQRAFYAADGALECALYADSHGDFIYGATPDPATIEDAIPIACNNANATPVAGTATYNPNDCPLSGPPPPCRLALSERISFNNGANCADVTIYKYAPPFLSSGARTYSTFIFSTGYNVSCSAIATASAGGRVIVRGIFERY